ncbi:expressed unknown protein [Seminavis robusta]|uniref:Uncharacterized protein n=1 Tax=Seminavis robusta TaxID=568900 RepID=A0A9N8DEB2_9STRA|nr:expressed unknown protein [Seminavis robusta]|eukprot:Sro32_g020640.1 n/a (228) ;mRNA; r:24416-25099
MMMIVMVPTLQTTSRQVSPSLTWEENYTLLENYIAENGGNNFSSPQEFWSGPSKVNQWLMYNKVELQKPRNRIHPVWIERKELLEQLGMDMPGVFQSPTTSASSTRPVLRKCQTKKKRRIPRNQEWMGWYRVDNIVEDSIDYWGFGCGFMTTTAEEDEEPLPCNSYANVPQSWVLQGGESATKSQNDRHTFMKDLSASTMQLTQSWMARLAGGNRQPAGKREVALAA